MFLFQVIFKTIYDWEGETQRIIFNDVSESPDLSISYALNYMKSNYSLFESSCFSITNEVEVHKYPIGMVSNGDMDIILSSSNFKLLYNFDSKVLSQIFNKSNLSILFDESIPSDTKIEPYFTCISKPLDLTNGDDKHQRFILSHLSKVANDIEWQLYRQYEI